MNLRHLFVAGALSIAATPSFAFSQYKDSVPNGRAGSQCLTCHTRSFGGEGWNDFGIDILVDGEANPDANPNDQNSGYNNQTPIWANICALDSDGDGATNGEELGDADCAWTIGDDDPVFAGGHPGDPDVGPGDVAAEGEGEGGGDPPPIGCTATSTNAPVAALALVLAGTALGVRRRR